MDITKMLPNPEDFESGRDFWYTMMDKIRKEIEKDASAVFVVDWTKLTKCEAVEDCMRNAKASASFDQPVNITCFCDPRLYHCSLGNRANWAPNLEAFAKDIQFWLNTIKSQCVVCYEIVLDVNIECPLLDVKGAKIPWFHCTCCSQQVCNVCIQKMESRRCPVCRSGYVCPYGDAKAAFQEARNSQDPVSRLNDHNEMQHYFQNNCTCPDCVQSRDI